jgi:hypothetical protein
LEIVDTVPVIKHRETFLNIQSAGFSLPIPSPCMLNNGTVKVHTLCNGFEKCAEDNSRVIYDPGFFSSIDKRA